MQKAELLTKLKLLSRATKNTPSPDEIRVLVESILDNKLTDAEIDRGYMISRDAPEPWWPKPGEFLARARPIASKAVVGGEADAIFQNLIDHPTLYGTYTPNGTIYDRRKVEAAHGSAAGIAFAAVASRFRNLEWESVPFVRRDFVAAYEDARRDHGAPLTLDPSRILPAPVKAPALSGDAHVETDGEGRAAFRALMDELRKRTGVGA